eukprot:1225037-Pyramimonas_sp.AAC.1
MPRGGGRGRERRTKNALYHLSPEDWWDPNEDASADPVCVWGGLSGPVDGTFLPRRVGENTLPSSGGVQGVREIDTR